MVNTSRKYWSTKLSDTLWAYRITYKIALVISPYWVVYGKTSHFPVELEHSTIDTLDLSNGSNSNFKKKMIF